MTHFELTMWGWKDGCFVVSSHHWRIPGAARGWCNEQTVWTEHWSWEEPVDQGARGTELE